MGLFDTIIAELECPAKKLKRAGEIQIKWSPRRSLRIYRIGGIVDLDEEYKGWIRENYVCNVCSKKTKGKFSDYIKVEDQKRHECYIHIKENKILEILSEKEFKKLNKPFIDPDDYEF